MQEQAHFLVIRSLDNTAPTLPHIGLSFHTFHQQLISLDHSHFTLFLRKQEISDCATAHFLPFHLQTRLLHAIFHLLIILSLFTDQWLKHITVLPASLISKLHVSQLCGWALYVF